jgi:hypothetical protein
MKQKIKQQRNKFKKKRTQSRMKVRQLGRADKRVEAENNGINHS